LEGVKDIKIDKKVKMGPMLLFVRALIAAVTIVLILSTAKMVGPTWAGLFSAFPNVMLPLMVIIHFSYSSDHTNVIIKNVPKGLASVVLYCFTVSLTYTEFGIYAGTVAAYGVATLYLAITQFRKEIFHR
ncbi:MAG: hypothetical protein LLG06_20870, partial [Desulfobacteraceae bacterium]|nr:hypothetical protein [Desulfobacteraceae bacterium]